MAELFEQNQIGKRQDISDAIFNVEASETPVTSMLKKDKDLLQKVSTWQTESYPNAGSTGTMDGADVASFEHVPRAELTGVAGLLRRPWKVSTFADNTEIAGLGGKKERANQKAKAIVILKQMMERRVLSAHECSLDNGTDEPNETRGMFKWLSTTEQTVYPVPAAYRPASATQYTGALASLSEDAFIGLLNAAFKVRKQPGTLDGIVGIDLKSQFDKYMAMGDAGATFGTMPVRTFNVDAEDRAVIRVVDILKFSAGTVRLHPSSYLLTDEITGAPTDYTDKSGAFIDLKMWAMAFLKGVNSRELPDLGAVAALLRQMGSVR
jgi:hypothetical protein